MALTIKAEHDTALYNASRVDRIRILLSISAIMLNQIQHSTHYRYRAQVYHQPYKPPYEVPIQRPIPRWPYYLFPLRDPVELLATTLGAGVETTGIGGSSPSYQKHETGMRFRFSFGMGAVAWGRLPRWSSWICSVASQQVQGGSKGRQHTDSLRLKQLFRVGTVSPSR